MSTATVPEAFAYYVYIPAEQRGELVHDLDEATDELTNCECVVTRLVEEPRDRVVTQTRLGSLYEALINIVIGFTINYFANLLIFPLFGLHISPGANFIMGCVYTVISLVRSYLIRRYFNAKLKALALRMAQHGTAT